MCFTPFHHLLLELRPSFSDLWLKVQRKTTTFLSEKRGNVALMRREKTANCNGVAMIASAETIIPGENAEPVSYHLFCSEELRGNLRELVSRYEPAETLKCRVGKLALAYSANKNVLVARRWWRIAFASVGVSRVHLGERQFRSRLNASFVLAPPPPQPPTHMA